MSPLLVDHIDSTRVQAVVREASEAGLAGTMSDLGVVLVADDSTTSFTFVEHGKTHQLDAYALLDTFEGNLTSKQLASRARLRSLREHLVGLGANAQTPFVPEAVSVFVRPYGDRPTSTGVDRVWPLASVSRVRGRSTADTPCLVVKGTDLQRLLPIAGGAAPDDRWQSAGKTWRLAFRPVLPGEEGCSP